MKKSYHTRIRELLRANPDGMTVGAVAAALDIDYQTARLSIRSMPDTYVDHWIDNGLNSWQAVYAMPELPPDEPMPAKRPNEFKQRHQQK